MQITQRSGEPWHPAYQVSYHVGREEWLIRKSGKEVASHKDENKIRAQAQALNEE